AGFAPAFPSSCGNPSRKTTEGFRFLDFLGCGSFHSAPRARLVPTKNPEFPLKEGSLSPLSKCNATLARAKRGRSYTDKPQCYYLPWSRRLLCGSVTFLDRRDHPSLQEGLFPHSAVTPLPLMASIVPLLMERLFMASSNVHPKFSFLILSNHPSLARGRCIPANLQRNF